jgi:Na+-transporting NADH:ubiquinone oxidoreductase subunit A
MSDIKKIKKGFNINMAGKASLNLVDNKLPETVAIKPTDFHDILRPKVIINVGDTVKAGTPILFDKRNDKIKYTAPVSGEIIEVKRGEKRKLLEIIILVDKNIEYESFPKYTVSDLKNVNKEDAQEVLLKSGVWPQIVQRPFGIVADPEATPKSIFISGFDTHPLAPDYDFLLKGQENYFQAGIDVLKKFTAGHVHLSISADREVSKIFTKATGVDLHKFSGPHPCGNVGVQIHHIDPINKGDVVWTINPYGVVQIGKLMLDGIYDASKVVAVTGYEVKEPQYYKTFIGGSIDKLIDNNLNNPVDKVRVISGNILSGYKVSPKGYLGFYDNMISVIKEGSEYDFLGWIKPTTKRLSYQRAIGLLSFLNPKQEFKLDTNTRGEERAFVQTGVFEKVTPMDILPEHLFKAIMAEDYDEMEALGIFEVVEEDLALCEFVDVSKHNLQEIVRDGINLIQYS